MFQVYVGGWKIKLVGEYYCKTCKEFYQIHPPLDKLKKLGHA